ncbi:MAG: hypothetical protein ACYSVY_06610 [Planctomycetota bacterium]
MASRLSTLRQRLVERGWETFHEGDYQSARSAFSSAEMLDRDDPVARAGALFCSVAERKYAQAVHDLTRMCERGSKADLADLFGVDYRVPERYVSSDQLNKDLASLVRFVETRRAQIERPEAAERGEERAANHQDYVGSVAVLTYALWHSGKEHRLEAENTARDLRNMDPAGLFSGFGELMAQSGADEDAGKVE